MSFQNARIVGRNIDSTEYHSIDVPRGAPDFPMSPSALKQFAPCARNWIDGYKPADTKAKAWGNLIDCLVFTPQQFKKRYCVVPDDAPKKPSSKQREARRPSQETVAAIGWWDDWEAENNGKIELSEEEQEMASSAVLRLRKDETIARFIDASEKQVWVAAEWHDKETKLVIPVRCLIDLEPNAESEFGKCLGDLKTTRSAALFPFLKDTFNFGHHIQAAFDLDLYRAALPEEDRTEWCLIVQENHEPWTTAKRAMSDMPDQPDNLLDLGRVTYKRLLENYCICLATGKWPDFEEMALLDKDLKNYVAQGWFYMSAKPFMMDYLPSAFEMPEQSEEPQPETESGDVPT